MSRGAKNFITKILAAADIEIGGGRPFDVQVHDERLFGRVLTQGTLGLGEAYMEGWWDSAQLDETLTRVLISQARDKVPGDFSLVGSYMRGVLTNLQRRRAFEVGERHYDIGNDLYAIMLDQRMIYSCGYWLEADDLDAAQEAKLDLVCRKIGLRPGMSVLDIGSGWGGFLKYAAEKYGIKGKGVTVSRQQYEYAVKSCEGLPVRFELKDYLDLEGRFDRIVSIGMFEHVGYKNYRRFFEKALSLLDPSGLMLLHTIGGNLSQTHGDPWSEKYIFPNGMLPSIKQVGAALEDVFVMEDWHNFGAYYDPTLMAWHARFEAAWPDLSSSYSEHFYRMWRYYLLSFAAVFRARHAQLWQIVLSPRGLPGGYRSMR